MEKKLKAAVAILAALLFVAIVTLIVLWERARLPLYEPDDKALIDRTIATSAEAERVQAREIERNTFAIVMQVHDAMCVELRARPSRAGGHVVCYSTPTGEQFYHRQRGPH